MVATDDILFTYLSTQRARRVTLPVVLDPKTDADLWFSKAQDLHSAQESNHGQLWTRKTSSPGASNCSFYSRTVGLSDGNSYILEIGKCSAVGGLLLNRNYFKLFDNSGTNIVTYFKYGAHSLYTSNETDPNGTPLFIEAFQKAFDISTGYTISGSVDLIPKKP